MYVVNYQPWVMTIWQYKHIHIYRFSIKFWNNCCFVSFWWGNTSNHQIVEYTVWVFKAISIFRWDQTSLTWFFDLACNIKTSFYSLASCHVVQERFIVRIKWMISLSICVKTAFIERPQNTFPTYNDVSPLYLILWFQEVEENNKYSRSRSCMN